VEARSSVRWIATRDLHLMLWHPKACRWQQDPRQCLKYWDEIYVVPLGNCQRLMARQIPLSAPPSFWHVMALHLTTLPQQPDEFHHRKTEMKTRHLHDWMMPQPRQSQ
jgi:hypothetical protein